MLQILCDLYVVVTGITATVRVHVVTCRYLPFEEALPVLTNTSARITTMMTMMMMLTARMLPTTAPTTAKTLLLLLSVAPAREVVGVARVLVVGVVSSVMLVILCSQKSPL